MNPTAMGHDCTVDTANVELDESVHWIGIKFEVNGLTESKMTCSSFSGLNIRNRVLSVALHLFLPLTEKPPEALFLDGSAEEIPYAQLIPTYFVFCVGSC